MKNAKESGLEINAYNQLLQDYCVDTKGYDFPVYDPKMMETDDLAFS